MPRPSPYDRLQEKLGKVGRAPTVDVGSAIDARRVKPGTKVPSGGVVTQRWGYRASIGKLGEDKAAHAMQPKVFITTDTNKLINEPGFDKAGLTFTAEGKFRYVSSDNKAYQKIGKISSVSAHERSLNFNLETERDRSLAIARDKARPYGERVLYRANSMVLKRILRNTSQAIKDGRLVLSVASHGGNATGIS